MVAMHTLWATPPRRVVALVTLALISTLASPVAAAPGTPGTPQPSTLVYAEDFQNLLAPSPIVRLTGYTGATGQTYTAAAPWLTLCNGWVASANQSVNAPAQVADCIGQGNWNQAQRLSQALGMAAGQTAIVARDNYAVSAYTSGNPGAGLVEFQTATNISFATSNRFISFSVDVAAVNCFANHPLLQFFLLDDAATAIPAGTQIDGCTSPRSVTVPALGVAAAGPIQVGTFTANGSVLISGTSIGVRMVNNQGSGGGNDHAFDNIRILDVTPQLDKSFTPTVVGVGQTSALTFTITNTDERASKNGWSFTDNLPAGLTVAGPAATTTCPVGVVLAPIGGSSVTVGGNLATGMASCTATVNVTSSTLGSFTNDASNISNAVGMSAPGPATVTFTEQPALSIVKSSTTTMLPAVGSPITYSFLVTNTGNVEMTGIAVSDPNATGIVCPVTTLPPGVATTCTGTHTVVQSDIDAGAVVNTATVVGTPPLGPPIAPVPSNQVTILGTQLPAMSIVKSSTTVTIPVVDDPIPYSFLVTNTGNVTMSDVAVTDPNTTGISCPLTTLAPAESMTCTGTHIVVQADLDAGEVVNTATLDGDTPNGTPIPPVPSNQVQIIGIQTPELSIVKATTETVLPLADELVPYSFLVTNIGNVTMTSIAVTDPNTTGVSCPVTALAPGESTTCTGTHVVTQPEFDAGTLVNSATVTGTPPSGTPIAPVPSNVVTIEAVQTPALAVVKASTTTVILAVDDVVPYTFEVVNIGNVTMTAIAVTDPNATGIFCPEFTLAPGISMICTGSHTVTQADVDAGALINTAAVTGTPPGGPPIGPVPSNQITVPVAQVESLSILKSSTTGILPVVGAPIPYEFLVTNNGNVTMTGIAPSDPNTTGIACPVSTLAPGASTICTGSHTVTQADLNAGEVVNTASVVGTPPSGTPIPPMPSNQVSIAGIQTPALAIVKHSTTTTITTAGHVVPYTFEVVNTGNVTITGIAVSDPMIAGVTCPATTLDPDISTTCTGTYTVTQADVDAGVVVNTASVVGTPPSGTPIPPVPSNPVTISAVQNPALSIVKASTTTIITSLGQEVPYTFTVTNIGNVTITGISVSDPKIAGVTCPATTLDPGISMTCTATYSVTAADLDNGEVVNNATVTGNLPSGAALPPLSANTVTIPAPLPFTDSRFVALTPERILDTRTINPQVGYSGPKPAANSVVELQVTGRGGVPMDDVTAVVMNLTVTEAEAPGFVTAWPTGFAQPNTSAVNADLGSSVPVIEQHLPNLVTVPVGAGGKVSIYTLTATHLVADVAGFYQAVSVSHEGRFMPVDPARVLDTRAVSGPVGYSGAKPVAGQTVSFPVAGHGGVPATGASAVMLTITATETNSRGFVTAFPAGGVLPWASNVNAEYANQTIANQVVVPLGANGEVSLYTQNGTHLVADVAGWFTDGTQPSSDTGLYHPIPPTRYLDSRGDGTSPRPSGGATLSVPLATTAIPAGEAGAVLYNLTGTQPAAAGFVTAYPHGEGLPWASNLNLERPGQTLSAHATTKVGTGDEIDLYTQSGTHLVVDVMGWYRK